jgi:hypothetical protein
MFFARFLLALAFVGAMLSVGSLAVQPASQPDQEQQTADAGVLVVTFLYMPPSAVEPTYHTAMWLEDTGGKLVKTLFVSNELSANDYKNGDACPDWVSQASWPSAEQSLVDAVTGPTPNVGSSTMSFDLDELGISPGTYVFNFQVHVTEKYNVRFRASVDAGQTARTLNIEALHTDGKAPSYAVVRDVDVRYVPRKPR